MILKELPEHRLASTDEHGKRVMLFPADVQGRYKAWRNVLHSILLAVFLLLPWIKLNGHQALLLDITHRRFSIFGMTFWAHDIPMLIFVLGSVLVGISLLTAVAGRVWCGWGCPETVFTENVYRRIERWLEGNAVQRQRLQQQPWTFGKGILKATKWTLFTLVTLIITHSFMAYFVGIDDLAHWITRSPAEHPTAFTFMLFLSAILLFFFGWFREQFCIILCPYGRFQSVLMDENSLVVAYNNVKGEPRRGSVPEGESQGGCINCYRCVQACPTGIDIRRGVQMECIACTACIDACHEVMDHKKKEPLIGYTTYAEIHGRKPNHFRPRVMILSTVLVAILSGLGYVLLTRPEVKTTVFNARTTPYQILETRGQTVILANQFVLSASNYMFEDAVLQIKPSNSNEAEIISQLKEITIKGGEESKSSFFVKFPKHLLQNGKFKLTLEIRSRSHEPKWESVTLQEVTLIGPF